MSLQPSSWNKSLNRLPLLLILFLLMILSSACREETRLYEDLRSEFTNPGRRYRPVVYWFWNGEISKTEISRQLHEMDESNTVGAVCIMAWEGLAVEYLSDEWFGLVRYACSVAGDLGLEVWLYDEQRWPSGHAGGKVLDGNPEFQAKCLSRRTRSFSAGEEYREDFKSFPVAIAALPIVNGRPDISAAVDLSGHRRDNRVVWKIPAGTWEIQIFEVDSCDFRTTFTALKYADLLDSKAVKKFMRLTYDAYYRHMPEYFGSVIKAIITDEPGFYCDLKPFLLNPRTVPWSPELMHAFKKRKGYDLKAKLPFLWQDGQDSRSLRRDFYEVLADMLQDNYFRPLQKWCREHKIKLNIQPSHEETLKYSVKMMGDYFKAMECSDIPAVDEVYHWDKNIIVPKLGASAARSFGHTTLYAEAFGAYGWGLSLAQMKAVSDWLYVRGVTRLMLSSFYFSMDGQWRFEVPPSFFPPNPQWKYFPRLSDYLARLSVVLDAAETVNQIAVLYPTQTAQALMSPADESAVDRIDQALQAVSSLLLENQLDFDYLDERTLLSCTLKSASDGTARLVGGWNQTKGGYAVLVLPAMRVISGPVWQKISEFRSAGGRVIAVREQPEICTDSRKLKPGALSNTSAPEDKIAAGLLFLKSVNDSLVYILDEYCRRDLLLGSSNPALNYIHKRKRGLDIYFISNHDSIPVTTEVSFQTDGRAELWDAENGTVSNLPVYEQKDGRTSLKLFFPPYGAKLIVFNKSIKNPPIIHSRLAVKNWQIEQDSLFIDAVTYQPGRYSTKIMWQGHEQQKGIVANLLPKLQLTDIWRFYPADQSFDPELRHTGSWTMGESFMARGKMVRANGHPYFSGSAVYEQSLTIDANLINADFRFILQAGNVRDVLEVVVNGHSAGLRCWPPYNVDIASYLKPGRNLLQLVVTNTLANEYEKSTRTYVSSEHWGKIQKSGLLSPVLIDAGKKIEMVAVKR